MKITRKSLKQLIESFILKEYQGPFRMNDYIGYTLLRKDKKIAYQFKKDNNENAKIQIIVYTASGDRNYSPPDDKITKELLSLDLSRFEKIENDNFSSSVIETHEQPTNSKTENIKIIQRKIGAKVDGIWGKETNKKMIEFLEDQNFLQRVKNRYSDQHVKFIDKYKTNVAELARSMGYTADIKGVIKFLNTLDV